jgi:hypothetical protein
LSARNISLLWHCGYSYTRRRRVPGSAHYQSHQCEQDDWTDREIEIKEQCQEAAHQDESLSRNKTMRQSILLAETRPAPRVL